MYHLFPLARRESGDGRLFGRWFHHIQNAAREPEVARFMFLCLNEVWSAHRRYWHRHPTYSRRSAATAATINRDLFYPDRIETGTYMAAAAMTRSQLKLTNASPGFTSIVYRKSTGLRH